MKVTFENNTELKSAAIIAEDELSIHNIEQFKAEIDKVLNEADRIKIDLLNMETFDVSAFQLLFSLKNTLKESGKELVINIDLQENAKRFLNQAGLNI